MSAFQQMKIGVLAETQPEERRVALVPDVAAKLVKLGFQVIVETGAGVQAEFTDDVYRKADVAIKPIGESC